MEPRLLLDGGPIVINEIMYHPAHDIGAPTYEPENLAEEWVELYNTSAADVNLLGWSLNRGVDYTFGDVTIGDGEYLVVAADRDAFLAKYTGFAGTVVGNWTDVQPDGSTGGHLSNSGDDVELENALGERIDIVSYADEGEWATRVEGPFEDSDWSFRGWGWFSGADGNGKSLELINPGLTNQAGQNWDASTVDDGTPGAANSVAAGDIAPLILDVTHGPAIPTPSDPVTVTARILDELGAPQSATLHWRVDAATPPAFSSLAMNDSGVNGDETAGDGIWTAVIPQQAHEAVVEYYVEATDGTHTRTWPKPTDLGQKANALYQVDETFDASAEWDPEDQPLYRIVTTAAEYDAWLTQMNTGSGGDSNAQMNATFMSTDGTGTRVRYLTGIRNRGEGTRHRSPHNYRVNIPTDNKWFDLSAVNFNTQYTQCQVAGAAIFQAAGLPAAYGAPVRLLTNGTDLAGAGSPQFGSYFRLEAYNSEFVDRQFTDDASGNMYKGIQDADLVYRGDDPDSYRRYYPKQTNASVDDWSDLIALTDAFTNGPDETFAQNLSQVINVDEWLRYFAVDLLIGNRENSLGGVGNQGHYIGDDYSLYFGVQDPRAVIVVHDLDTVLGQGDYVRSATSTPEGLFPTSAVPVIGRLLKDPAFTQRYYEIFQELIATTFAAENINPLLDQVLGGWVSSGTIQSMKDYVVARNAHILSLIPSDLTASSGLGQSQGYDYTTSAGVHLSGTADAARTARVLVNGVEVPYSPWEGAWTTSGITGTQLISVPMTGTVWDYEQSDTDLGTAWRAKDYDPATAGDGSTWQSGPALLGLDGDFPAGTFGTPLLVSPTTRYLRTHFTFEGDPADVGVLRLYTMLDDGAIIYLNGTRVAWPGFNDPASVTHGTYADRTITNFSQEGPFAIDASALENGDNVLAVEVHQSTATSTDVVWGMRLEGFAVAPAAITLKPGINRITVQALDPDGAEIERIAHDIWYNDGAMTDVSGSLPAGTTTWTAEAGPYHVTGDLTVPAGATLVIEPGTTVFFDAGRRMTVNGKLDARGTGFNHIRFTKTPGQASWAGLYFPGGAEVSEIAYADIEYSDSAGQSIEATSGARVHLDHITWANHNAMYLDWYDSSIRLTNSVLPGIGSAELVHYWGFPADGYAVFDGNWFGAATGYNDIIDLTGGQRPGPIAQFTNNVFAGGGDDCLDLDAADAYVAGNVFMHIHQDASRESKSYAVTTGTESLGGVYYSSNLTVVGNLFYDVDHALLAKDGGFITAIGNTIVNVNKRPDIGDATTAVISFYENRSGQWPGVGAYLEGNIIYGAERLFENPSDLGTTTFVTLNNNIIYDINQPLPAFAGTGNIYEDPRLVNTTNVTDPWTDFALRPGSPAIGTGPNGVDMGALPGYRATLAGEPDAVTRDTGATLTVGGPDVYGYKYRVTKDGAWLGDWSAEVPVDWTIPKLAVTSLVRSGSVATATVPGHGFANGDVVVIQRVSDPGTNRSYMGPFTIYNVTANTFDYTVVGTPTTPAPGPGIFCWKPELPPAIAAIELALPGDGAYTVNVITKNSAGTWQDEADATVSRTWTVDTAWSQLRISEILADNVAAYENTGTFPDVIELHYDAPAGAAALDLGGMVLADTATGFTIPAGTLINPGQYRLFLADPVNPLLPGIHTGFGLNAGGDVLYLYDTDGLTEIDSVAFGVQVPDLAIARLGRDLTWGLATPTLGGANAAQPTGDPATLRINEWFADGDVVFEDDYLELANPDPLPVDMSGLYLSDRPAPRPDMYRIPALSFIAGNSSSVFTADDDPSQGADHVNFKLSPYQGLISLSDADLNRLDLVYYTSQTTDYSQGLTPDVGDNYAFFRLPLPGVGNPGIMTIVDETVTPIFDFDNVWYYNQTANLDGIPWKAEVYAGETAWPQGEGLLRWPADEVPEALRGTLLTLGRLTYYFRTHFTYNGAINDNTHLLLSTYIDDGAVIYLNGEVLRYPHMSTPTPTYSTAASSHESSLEQFDIALTELPAGTLHTGDNVLAVEVHQTTAGSSDIVWGASLEISTRETTVIISDPVPEGIMNLFDSLRITEVMYHPDAGGAEFVELQNTGAADLDLAGVRLRGGIDFTFPAMTLTPGQYVLVVEDLNDFQNRYGTGLNVAGVYNGALSNGGEKVVLELPDPYDAAALRFSYRDDWYGTVTDGDGLSLVLLDATAHRRTWKQGSAWRPSSAVGGSPGADDPEREYAPGTVVINEVLAHQDDPVYEDWIELKNTTNEPIDISGWYLSDDGADLQKFEIPAGTILGIQESTRYAVFTEVEHFGLGPNAFALSELGDDVWLSSASGGVLGTYRETASFGASNRDVTLGRYATSTGETHFVALATPTMGYANADPRVGPVVLSEVMYAPTTDPLDEFIELYNPSGADVPLYDPAYPANTWKFTDGLQFTFPAGVTLPAGGYLLVTRGDPAVFRTTFSIPAEVPIYGPFELGTSLDNAGETVGLSKPGTPELVETSPGVWEEVVPYILVDALDYDNALPWPAAAATGGASLERVAVNAYGDDVANWTAGGSPGADNATMGPRVASVTLNERAGRSVGAIEPGGIGVETITVTFSQPVVFLESDVTLEAVTIDDATGAETIDATLTPLALTGSGTETMTITLAPRSVVDTWVKVTLDDSIVSAASGRHLDGEARSDSSGLGYLGEATADLPSGNGVEGGQAVLYVGSLRGDMWGEGFFSPDPEGQITLWDINGFTSKYQTGDPDADLWGAGFFDPTPNGVVDAWDINAFTTFYQDAVTNGVHLAPLPTAGAPLAAGDPQPILLEPDFATAHPAPIATPAPTNDLALAPAPAEAVAVLTVEPEAPSPAWSPTPADADSDAALAPDGGVIDLLALPALELPLSA